MLFVRAGGRALQPLWVLLHHLLDAQPIVGVFGMQDILEPPVGVFKPEQRPGGLLHRKVVPWGPRGGGYEAPPSSVGGC